MATDTAPSEQHHDRRPRRSSANIGFSGSSLAGTFAVPILLVVLVIVFSLAKPDSFANWSNYRAILDNQTVVVLLAMAAMMPLIVGQFDLSIVAVLTLSQTLALGLAAKQGWPAGLTIVIGLLSGLVVGLVNGLVVVKLHVSSFVTTLASATILGGLTIWYTGNQVIYDGVPQSIIRLGGRVGGVPLSVIYTGVIAIVLWFVMTRLVVARRMYAVGGNAKAAAITGIRTDRYVVGAFMIAGLFAAVAGIILGARLGSAEPSSSDDLLLPAFAGAFLGATTITPGRYNVIGTVVSVYALSVATSGFQQLGAQEWVTQVFNGAALILAVAVSGFARRSKVRKAREAQLARIHSEDSAVQADDTAAA